jgi:polyhydroxybutyrate depolymerase
MTPGTLVAAFVAAALTTVVVACGSVDDGASREPAAMSAPVDGGGPTVVSGTLDFRDYELVVPSTYDGSTAVPLVVLLHGYTSSGAAQESYFRLTPLAEDREFLLVYPDGTFDPVGSRFWNATDACCNFADAGVDDVGHLLGLIDRISDDYAVDPDRIHLVGHSNGGFMAYRMACEHADVIASIVSLAGATYADPDDCDPVEPVGVVQVHGTLDPVIRYEGGVLLGNPHPGAFETAAMWAAANGCDGTTEMTAAVLDLDRDIAGADTTVTRFAGCPDAGRVELWTIEGGSHVPALTEEFRVGVIDVLLES